MVTITEEQLANLLGPDGRFGNKQAPDRKPWFGHGRNTEEVASGGFAVVLRYTEPSLNKVSM